MNVLRPLTQTTEAALAARLLEGFRRISADVEGVTRPAWSPIETECHALLTDVAAEQGLAAHRDAVGNLWLAPPTLGDAPAPACGSHTDSVPRGGNFDGAAGVVAGLICAIRAARAGIPLRALALRGEESPWFGAPYVGTRAAFGALSEAELATPRRDSGRTLAEHIAEQGGSPQAAGAGKPLPEIARTTRLWELHIEQGPVLTDKNLPAAAVSAVRGHIRFSRAICRGEAGHSGVVPRHLRRDPVLALAELLADLDTLWARAMQAGADMVVTAGMVQVDPAEAAPTRIPDTVSFSLDIRSAQPETLKGMLRTVRDRCAAIGAQRGVSFDLGPLAEAAPIILDESGRSAIEAALQNPFAMVSGAGHDAAEFARRGIPSGMVFVRNANGSHNPRESMEIADLMAGVEAMWRAIRSVHAS